MSKRKSLLKNTVMLYILSFSTYIIGFVLIPYETRVLQPEKFGLLGVATAAMTYFQLIIDFGFLLSATEEVSKNREDKDRLSTIFSAVTFNKILLSVVSLVILMGLCYFIPHWRQNTLFFLLTFAATAINSFIPDYLYRGIEKMGTITFRTVVIKLIFALMIFVFVKEPEDYMYIPVINIAGNTIALIGVYIHLFFKINVRFVWCSARDMCKRMKTSSTFFLSRIATTIYTVSNTIILDVIFGNTMTAYYTSANKLVSTAKSGMSPIADSLYPYMIKNRDYKIVKKILLLLEPLIIIGCTVLFIFAEPICIWLFGAEYKSSAYALRSLLPVVIFTLPNYILGFPVLGAMGLSKHANYSIIFASAIHIINLFILYLTDNLNMVSLGIATSIAEGLILLYRGAVIWMFRKNIRIKSEE